MYNRRLPMKLDQETANVYSRCFACLGDPTRIVILNLLARSDGPLTVGEIVAAVDVGQSTVSHHLKKLAEVGFAVSESRGASTLWRVNERCLDCFPSAADVVMGRAPRLKRRRVVAAVPPWLPAAEEARA